MGLPPPPPPPPPPAHQTQEGLVLGRISEELILLNHCRIFSSELQLQQKNGRQP